MSRVQARGLWFAYEADSHVLCNVDAAVAGGVLSGIVGPNGCGKSTLLRILAGLLRPRRGDVLLEDRPLRDLPGRERARTLAFLPQDINPAFSLSAFEVVCLGRYPHAAGWGTLRRHDLEVAERCLEQTMAADLRHRPFGQLSGGERQRVLLASVLAQEPALLLLDEPTAALDIHHQVEVFELLRTLARGGYGIATVTHDLNLAAQYCDELLLLSGDHTSVATGTPEQVLTEPLLAQAYGAAIRVGRHPFAATPFVAAQPSAPR
jgi:iron complex transport system ATP-binding protein